MDHLKEQDPNRPRGPDAATGWPKVLRMDHRQFAVVALEFLSDLAKSKKAADRVVALVLIPIVVVLAMIPGWAYPTALAVKYIWAHLQK